jgi:hypothetical protein
LTDAEDEFLRPAGTRLDLEVLRDGVRQKAVATLKELLPIDAPLRPVSDP